MKQFINSCDYCYKYSVSCLILLLLNLDCANAIIYDGCADKLHEKNEATKIFCTENKMPRSRRIDEISSSYDYIIVGTGSAGSIVAARLAADPKIKVLALEAGPDETQTYAWWSHQPSMAILNQKTDIDWQYKTEPQKYACRALNNKVSFWPRGKVIGGSSVLNYMLYVRCNPNDFDQWRDKHGAKGWGYKDLLPYFKKMEAIHFKEQDPGFRGKKGPITVRRVPTTKGGEAFRKAANKFGIVNNIDYNGKNYKGISSTQMNINDDGERDSTSRKYLYPVMKLRKNLHVLSLAHVTKVLIDDSKKAFGVEFLHGGQKNVVNASTEVILSAGAINTPQIMQLSGLGPRSYLQNIGIKVHENLPNAGANLKDHILIPLLYSIDKNGTDRVDSRGNSDKDKFWDEVTWATVELLAFVRSHRNVTEPDIQIMFRPDDMFFKGNLSHFVNLHSQLVDSWYQKYDSEYGNRRIVSGIVTLNKPKSVGFVAINSKDPLAHPLIQPNYLASEKDVRALARGLGHINYLMLKSLEMSKFKPKFLGPDIPECRILFKKYSQAFFICIVEHITLTSYHPVGTCKMGTNSQNSVVNNQLKVHGISNLRIADASIFPDQISGNTNVPAMVVGEKAADLILEDWHNNMKFEQQTKNRNTILKLFLRKRRARFGKRIANVR